MKSRYDFLNDFLNELSDGGFIVETTNEIDIVAEVYNEYGLFCVITGYGDIIYENVDEAKVQEFNSVISKIQKVLNITVAQPVENLTELEIVELSRGAYFKLIESADTALLCRYNGIFGYEYVTCKKLGSNSNSKYYREQLSFNNEQAQDNFAERSNLKLGQVSLYNEEELRLVLACLTKVICLDNSLDVKMESDIKCLIHKTEEVLPIIEPYTPRDYYERE